MANYLTYDRFVPTLDNLKHVQPSDVAAKKLETLQVIERALVHNPDPNKWCIAFSGGKDSIVLSYLIREYFKNIEPTRTSIPFRGISEISFCFKSGINDTIRIAAELGMELETREGLTWNWLKKPQNHKYCAPPMSIQSNVYSMRQQRTVKNFGKEKGMTGVFYGRRKQENTVRQPLYQLKSGQWQCHPLREWTTDEIWWFIHTYEVPYPKLYHSEIGKKEGFTPFLLPPEHFTNHAEQGGVWHVIHEYEDWIVPKMAEFYEPAKAYIDYYVKGIR